MEPLTERPVAAQARRRPSSAAALASRLPRSRAENVLDLAPLALPATTRTYTPPRPHHTQVSLDWGASHAQMDLPMSLKFC